MTYEFNINRKGHRFLLRQILPEDKPYFQKGFERLSLKSRYLRFFSIQNRLSESQLEYLTNADGHVHMAWGILDVTSETPHPVGVGRFVRLKNTPNIAEVAVTITDDYQKIGLGRTLIILLNIFGAREGVKTFRYHLLPENRFAIDILKNVSDIVQKREGATTAIDLPVISRWEDIPQKPQNESIISEMRELQSALDEQLDNMKE